MHCIAQIQFAGTNPIYLNAIELPVNWSPSGRLEKRGKPGGAARGAHALLLHRPLLLRRIQVRYLPEHTNLICTACKSDLCGRKMSPQVQQAAGKLHPSAEDYFVAHTYELLEKPGKLEEYIALHCTIALHCIVLYYTRNQETSCLPDFHSLPLEDGVQLLTKIGH